MKRLTTDDPQNNLSIALNLFYVKNRETMVRGGGPAPDYPDVTLNEYIRTIAKTHGIDLGIGEETQDDMETGEAMFELLFDGVETLAGVLATLYAAGWAFSELRELLSRYDDTGLSPQEIEEMKFRMEGLEK